MEIYSKQVDIDAKKIGIPPPIQKGWKKAKSNTKTNQSENSLFSGGVDEGILNKLPPFSLRELCGRFILERKIPYKQSALPDDLKRKIRKF